MLVISPPEDGVKNALSYIFGEEVVVMVIMNMQIKRAIAHEVLRQTKATVELAERPPIENDSLIPLDNRSQQLISERLITALGSGSSCVDVSVDEDRKEPFLQISSMLDAVDNDFITYSQSLARQLSKAQIAGSIKSGSALFIQGSCMVDDQLTRFITVIKADSDRALSKQISDNTISFEYIQDILFGSSQRLIKIAFFTEDAEREKEGPRSPDDFSIKVYDHLMQNSNDRAAAAYFYKTFLGCKIAVTAAVNTKKFFETITNFINNSKLPQDKKVTLRGDVISHLRGNVDVINPTTFAKEVLPKEYQDPFLSECREKGVADSFSRDITLIRAKLRRQSIRFSSNVTLYAPPDVLKESVIVKNQDEEGWTDIRIRGFITQ